MSEISKQDKTDWEKENNPEFVFISDPEMGGETIKVETELLIYPDEFAGSMNNNRLRRLAIEQKVLKEYPFKFKTRKLL